MSGLYQLFYGMSIFHSVLLTCLGAAADIWAVSKLFKNKRNGDAVKKITLIVIIIVSLLTIVAAWSREFLVEVPDVLGKPYENAQWLLDDAHLKYEVSPQNHLMVLAQSPASGEIVPKGAEIALTLGDARSDPEWIARFEESINAEYGTLMVRLKSTEVELRNGADVIACFGPIIDTDIVRDAYLLQATYAVKYINYTVKDGMLVFEQIPIGIPFDLTIASDDYEEVAIDVCLSSENMVDNVFTLTLGIIPKNVELRPATSFRVADSNHEFLSEVQFEIKWPYSDIWYGRYQTDNTGTLEYTIWLIGDKTIDVCLNDPLGNGMDSYCQVQLHKLAMGDMSDDDIIIVSKDNSCYTVKESEFFGY